MQIIYTINDLEKLNNDKISESLKEQVVTLFNKMLQKLGKGNASEFSLKRHGPIVILEDPEEVYDLSDLFLPPLEYIDTEHVIKHESCYEIIIETANSYLITIYIPMEITEQFDEEMQEWLQYNLSFDETIAVSSSFYSNKAFESIGLGENQLDPRLKRKT
ncbi:MAG: hypothetical protein CVU87_08100 [Firmicutes bacterium HGW-Firmicutes-12]|jgi:hypothetical protein|nr:MAG: hypothetical protein CVU87_08100 [Firmicutes bacterium HGW-Firmicutes-12]